MSRSSSVPVPFLLSLSFTALATAQDAPPAPAAELKKLEPWVGSWAGEGKMSEPTGDVTPWRAQGTYRWCLGGHWLQEDFQVVFEGNPAPIVFRNYVGWDRENGRYVVVGTGNDGHARLNEFSMLPDGTMLTFLQHHQMGMTWTERARVRVQGDAMSLVVDMLMPEGASMQLIDGSLSRAQEEFAGDFGAAVWMNASVHDAVKKLARMAGNYELDGQMIMVPGQPATKITGSERYEVVYGGTVMYGVTMGHAEGLPDAYESHAFWAWNEHTKCVDVVFVDNMGQVGDMQGWWIDGAFVSTDAAVTMGAPTTQRFVVTFDEQGRLTTGVGHTTIGAMAPFESFRASYRKK